MLIKHLAEVGEHHLSVARRHASLSSSVSSPSKRRGGEGSSSRSPLLIVAMKAFGRRIASLMAALVTNLYPANPVGSSMKKGARRRLRTNILVLPVPSLFPIEASWRYPY